MSPRTDSYLSLCLEQASKSPLHYRHGSIVVSGGKVIGQGYNHYRPGFNGGALKTGQLASSSTLDGAAIAALKQKQRQKRKSPMAGKESSGELRRRQPEPNGPLTPFKDPAGASSSGSRHLANTPLSMHSEMMAIHSALSLSGSWASQGSVRSARWLEKSRLKLPGCGKRQLRLQGLKAYIEAVCGEQAVLAQSSGVQATAGGSHSGKLQVQEWCFGDSTDQRSQGQGGGVQRGQGGGVAESVKQCRERTWREAAYLSTQAAVSASCPPPRFQPWTDTTTTPICV